MKNKIPTIHIIGGKGKMGQWFQLFFQEHNVPITISGRDYKEKKTLIEQADIVIVSVPISQTETVISDIKGIVRKDALLTDVTSVKVMPLAAMEDAECGTLGMHPLFGPTINTTVGQKIIFCHQNDNKYVKFLQELFEKAGFEVLDMSPEEHDYQVAYIQALTHATHLLYAKTILGQEQEILTKLQTPTFAMHALTMGRVLNQDVELMADIELYNPYFPPVFDNMVENAKQLLKILQKGDKKAFLKLFTEEVKDAKNFSNLSLFQTNRIIQFVEELPTKLPTKASVTKAPKSVKLAYLGPAGTYSELAAKQAFPKAESYVPQESIYSVFQAVLEKKADFGVVPAENSQEGTVRSTMDYLMEMSLSVSGSFSVPIHHQLLSNEKMLEDIMTVVSHPQAVGQCRRWISKNLPKAKIISVESTTNALEKPVSKYAYIASENASKQYKLPILAKNIQDQLFNSTRFYVISPNPIRLEGLHNNKTLLFVTVYNRVGILRDILNVFANHNLNLSKLESRPSQEKLWDYHFFIEVDAKDSANNVKEALKDLESYCPVIRILGQT